MKAIIKPIETYVRDLHYIRSTGGTAEQSYYTPLANLFNAIGKMLKPKVRCIMNPKNQGAGIPDGGLFTPDQKATDEKMLKGQIPSRGVIEAKPTSEDAWLIADDKQVSKYWNKYRQVLVTNFRDFIFVSEDIQGKPTKLESYRLSGSEKDFWAATGNPHKMAIEHAELFTEFLMRVMMHAAPLTTPESVASLLASYARDARFRIEGVDLPTLSTVRSALEEALGLKFEGKKGDHFFRSTLVQTLFYGVFSAWVLWSKNHPASDSSAHFDWRTAAWSLQVPMIRTLFEQVATPTNLGPTGLVEVLDWTGSVLNRVKREPFFKMFEDNLAVQYFYEPFLKAFDPELRKDLGVWYTPPEVVQYMVSRVDSVLKEELKVNGGLANENVFVLDPACGTGAYLVEVLKHIHTSLGEEGADSLTSQDVKQAAMDRVFGFEILPAPFVVAHLQLGLMLQNIGAPLTEKTDKKTGQKKNERVGVYLTNALTGWDPPSGPKPKLLFPELEQERDAAEKVKQERPILVVLGNPPYNSKPKKGKIDILYSSAEKTSPSIDTAVFKKDLSKPVSKGGWDIKKFNLDDLYVRFFRLAERRIAEKTGKGIIAYISNSSYLHDPSFVVMRKRFFEEFDELWIDCMNGDSRETGKKTPDGKSDPSVFSTKYNREGIRVGTAITVMLRQAERSNVPTVHFRNFWGASKLNDLKESLKVHDFEAQYELLQPEASNRFLLRRQGASEAYKSWPLVAELCGQPPARGFLEGRRNALINVDRLALEERMRLYYNPDIDWETLEGHGLGITKDAARYNAKKARLKVLKAEKYNADNLRRYTLRPFETRYCYFSSVRPLWNEPRPELWAQCWPGNAYIVTRFKTEKTAKGSPIYFSTCLVDYQSLARNVSAIPIRLRPGAVIKGKKKQKKEAGQEGLFSSHEGSDPKTIANLSEKAREYLKGIGLTDPDANIENAGLIWMHTLAIGYSSKYLAENGEGIRQDWPRIPLPDSMKFRAASCAVSVAS